MTTFEAAGRDGIPWFGGQLCYEFEKTRMKFQIFLVPKSVPSLTWKTDVMWWLILVRTVGACLRSSLFTYYNTQTTANAKILHCILYKSNTLYQIAGFQYFACYFSSNADGVGGFRYPTTQSSIVFPAPVVMQLFTPLLSTVLPVMYNVESLELNFPHKYHQPAGRDVDVRGMEKTSPLLKFVPSQRSSQICTQKLCILQYLQFTMQWNAIHNAHWSQPVCCAVRIVRLICCAFVHNPSPSKLKHM